LWWQRFIPIIPSNPMPFSIGIIPSKISRSPLGSY
jgi:hypothetical protein